MSEEEQLSLEQELLNTLRDIKVGARQLGGICDWLVHRTEGMTIPADLDRDQQKLPLILSAEKDIAARTRELKASIQQLRTLYRTRKHQPGKPQTEENKESTHG